MKKFFALLLAVLTAASVFALVGCAGKKAEALGTFVTEKHKYVSEEEWVDDTQWELDLAAEGKGTSKRDGNEYDVTWELDGENITIKETFAGLTNEFTGTLKDGVLDIFNGDLESPLTCEYVFNKK